MDQASYHTGDAKIYWFLDRGMSVMFLPASSSDLSPIERVWGVYKTKLIKKLSGY